MYFPLCLRHCVVHSEAIAKRAKGNAQPPLTPLQEKKKTVVKSEKKRPPSSRFLHLAHKVHFPGRCTQHNARQNTGGACWEVWREEEKLKESSPRAFTCQKGERRRRRKKTCFPLKKCDYRWRGRSTVSRFSSLQPTRSVLIYQRRERKPVCECMLVGDRRVFWVICTA